MARIVRLLVLALAAEAIVALPDTACTADRKTEEAILLQGKTTYRHKDLHEDQALQPPAFHSDEIENTRLRDLGDEIRDFQQQHRDTLRRFPQMTREEQASAEDFLATLADDLAEDFREMAIIHAATQNTESSLLEVHAKKEQVEGSRRRWFRRRSPVVSSVVSTVSDTVDAATDTASDVVDTAVDTTSDVVDTAVDTTGDVVDIVRDIVSDAADTVTDAADTLTDAAGNAIDTSVNAVGFVVDAAGNVAGAAVSFADSMADAVIDTTGDGLDIVVGATSTFVDAATGVVNTLASYIIDGSPVQVTCKTVDLATAAVAFISSTSEHASSVTAVTCGGDREPISRNSIKDCVTKATPDRRSYISYNSSLQSCQVADTCDELVEDNVTATTTTSPPNNEGGGDSTDGLQICYLQYHIGTSYNFASNAVDSAIDTVGDVVDTAVDTVGDVVDVAVGTSVTVLTAADSAFTSSISLAVEQLIRVFDVLDTAQSYAGAAISHLQNSAIRDIQLPDIDLDFLGDASSTIANALQKVPELRDAAVEAANVVIAVTGTLLFTAAQVGDELADATTLTVSESVQSTLQLGVTAAQEVEAGIEEALAAVDAIIERSPAVLSPIRAVVADVLDDVRQIVAGIIEATLPFAPCLGVAVAAAAIGGSAGLVIGVTVGAAGGAVLGATAGGIAGGVTGIACSLGFASIPLAAGGMALGGVGGAAAGAVVTGVSLAAVTGGLSGLAAGVICMIEVEYGISEYIANVASTVDVLTG